MTELSKVLIMAGGTGGHIFPALAIAKLFIAEGIIVSWLGSAEGMEAEIVSQQAIPIDFIQIKALRGKSVWQKCLAPFKLASAVLQAKKIIQQRQPDLVIGMGGFVSAPGGIAAWLLGKPLVIHEQNAIAGLTNRILARLAQKIFQAFPDAFPKKIPVQTVGNPVRQSLINLPHPASRQWCVNNTLHVLILGGSQGAHALNHCVPQALAQLKQPIEIIHQCGRQDEKFTREIYQKLSLNVEIKPFIDDMATVYRWADLVICRAGALTIAELMAVGLPSILIPYPHAVDDHQTLNAQFLVTQHAACMIAQAELSNENLIKTLLSMKNELPQMAKHAYALRQVEAGEIIIEQCKEIGSGHHQ
ncbi:MAG: undecaprenyldiphospho-muramoylpentapeptide beta-N-acetylglucosaminyltransferase [Legionellales bacterium]|nr:undecaprenyldiphospho-muramoylpentapeptide beta-N-acetylglucosaminyltransferase [Legionellales bacterium]